MPVRANTPKDKVRELQRKLLLVRYADDFVAMCGTESMAKEALRRLGIIMKRLSLVLLRGWGNYFRTGTSYREFERLQRWKRRRGGREIRMHGLKGEAGNRRA